MKDFFVGLALIFVCAWLIINLMTTVFGLGEGFSRETGCTKETSRIGRVMPGYIFGCWLSEVPK